jgi:dipeptidyl aminopeptidase/acylaminoacyl peptidase
MRKSWKLSVVAMLWSATLAFGQTFSIEQALSAPFSSDLLAAPQGDAYVWVVSQQGSHNLWVAESDGQPNHYSAHPLTHFTDDDGQDIYDVAWSNDGQHIAYVRGGDPEAPAKPSPDPAQLVAGVPQDIYVLSLDGGDAKKVAQGYAPVFSPTGDSLTYISKGEIWQVDLAGSDHTPKALFYARGSLSSVQWSPDGKNFAFVSHRGDHSFIGVYNPQSNSYRYLDPGTDNDTNPVWSPDSQHVAFFRVPTSFRSVTFSPQRTAVPWSIRIADLSTGKGHQLWRGSNGNGSTFMAHALYWTAADRIVFPWEGDGWQHLYSISTQGGAPTLLTPGNFEVEHTALGADHTSIIYSSNQDDIDRRHVWSVDVNGGAARALTHGDGIEVSPAVGAHGIVVLRSDVHTPLRPAYLSSNGELRDLAPQLMPANYPGAQFVTPQQILFKATDGLQLHGQLFLPSNVHDGKRHPAIVFFHGGSMRQMLLGYHYMNYYSNAYAMNQYLASQGYIVFSVNYRSGTGYGLDFREALNYGRAGASELNDVKGAALYLRARADVDPAHIGVWGGSYGGYLTAMALAHDSDLYAAGVDMSGVHDWKLELQIFQPDNDLDTNPQASQLAWNSSPLSAVKTWRSPVLLIQGDDDRNVQFTNTVLLADALSAQGVEHETLVFPDEIHSFMLHKSWLAAYTAEADFFRRHLLNGASPKAPPGE